VAERTFIDNGDTVEVHTATCLVCGKRDKVTISKEGYLLWIVEGEYMQVALKDLSSEDRELILTGLHPECWDLMFIEED
jgi:hypothetical protein